MSPRGGKVPTGDMPRDAKPPSGGSTPDRAGGMEARAVVARALFLDALPELEPTLPPNYALAAWDQVATTTADRTSLAPFYRAADAVLAALDLPALLAEARAEGAREALARHADEAAVMDDWLRGLGYEGMPRVEAVSAACVELALLRAHTEGAAAAWTEAASVVREMHGTASLAAKQFDARADAANNQEPT